MKKYLSAILTLTLMFSCFCVNSFALEPKDVPNIVCLDREYNFLSKAEYKIINAGEDFVAMIRPDNSLWMFGSNVGGRLGIGDKRTSYNAPVKVMEDVKRIKTTENFTTVFKNDGTIWGFGQGISYTPMLISDSLKDFDSNQGMSGFVDKDGKAFCTAFKKTREVADNAKEVYVIINNYGGEGYGVLDDRSHLERPIGIDKSKPIITNFVIILHNDGTLMEYAFDYRGVMLSPKVLAKNVDKIKTSTDTMTYLTVFLKDGRILGGSEMSGLKEYQVTDWKDVIIKESGAYVLKNDNTLWNITKNTKLGDNVKLFAVVKFDAAFMIHSDNSVSMKCVSEDFTARLNAVNYAAPVISYTAVYDDIYAKTMEIIAGVDDKYERAKRISYWISSNVKYEFSDHDQSGVAAFRTGTGVCAAYADLTKIMFEYAGIPTNYVTGGNHAWNICIIDGVTVFLDNTGGGGTYEGVFDSSLFVQHEDSGTYSRNNYDDWAAEEIRGAYDYNLIDSKLYCFKNHITREQFCSLIRASIEEAKGESIDSIVFKEGKSSVVFPFTDCYSNDVAALYRLGIVQGTSDTTFSPFGSLTRQEAAKIMTSLAMYFGKDTNADVPLFADSWNIDAWAVPGVSYACCNGIMKGDGVNFLPKDNLTGQEAIIICFRYLGNIIG